MSCVTSLVGGVYFVRWLSPAATDFDRISIELRDALRKGGERVIYLNILPEGSPLFDDRTRKRMVAHLVSVKDRSESVHFVVEGHGFRTSAKRSMVTGVLLAAGQQAKFIHSTLREALEHAERSTGRNVGGLRPPDEQRA
jgi:hypothetical protein